MLSPAELSVSSNVRGVSRVLLVERSRDDVGPVIVDPGQVQRAQIGQVGRTNRNVGIASRIQFPSRH